MPEPQPISAGSISQGRPERSTNRMPVGATRFSIGRRPSGAAEVAGAAERSQPRDHRGEAVWPCQTNAENHPPCRSVRRSDVEPRYDEEARPLGLAAHFEAGQVHPPGEAPWLGPYAGELLAFPNGRNDDQVDATTYALHYLTARPVRNEPPARRSRESIRAVRKRSSEAEQSAVMAKAILPPGDETYVTVENNRRVLHVPASSPSPMPDRANEMDRRAIRRSLRHQVT